MAADQLPPELFGEATYEMSAEEFGVYVRLLVHLSRRGGSAPFDPERLARVCGVDGKQLQRVWDAIGAFFEVRAGQLLHPLLSEAIERAKAASARGQAMASARWGKGGGGNGTGGAHTPDGDAQPDASSIPPASSQAAPPASTQALVPASAQAIAKASPLHFNGGFGGSVSDLDLTLFSPASEKSDPDQTRARVERFDVRAVFEHYRRYHPRSFPSPKSGAKEWALVRKRMDAGYTVADLCQAIDGYHVSPWHCGDNPGGTKYLGLALIVRDDDHVNRGIEFATAPPRPMHGRELRAAQTLAACLEQGPPEDPQWMTGITRPS